MTLDRDQAIKKGAPLWGESYKRTFAGIKVCYIIATTEGAVWACEQLRELRDRYGFDVQAILNGDQGSLVDRFKAAEITVHVCDFDFTSATDLLSLPRKVVALVRLLWSEKYDIIQTHLFHSMIIGRIAAWLADVPVRFSMIAGPFHLEAYTPRWIDRLTCWMDTAIIASCEYTRELYKEMGVPGERVELIYYGPDETRFTPGNTPRSDLRKEFGWPPTTPLIAMVAYFYTDFVKSRWIPPKLWGRSAKGHDDLINAAPLVLNEFPNAKFLLIGSAWQRPGEDYLRRMKELTQQLGLESSIIFPGYRGDIPGILRDIDIAVQPSLSENLGGTIESLLMECPTVATRVGGLTDSVVHNSTGILVEPGNPPSLANGIIQLLRNPTHARALAKAGRERMLAGFTLTRTVEALSTLYKRKLKLHPFGYRATARLARYVLGSALCGIIVLRYSLLDTGLLRLWDLGWRPWRIRWTFRYIFTSWKNRFYAFVGRNAPSFGLRYKLTNVLRLALRALQPAAIKAKATYFKHVTLYRFYAFVGSHAPSFGVRKSIRRAARFVKHVLRRVGQSSRLV